MREKYVSEFIESEVRYEESKLLSFHKNNSRMNSFRVYRDGKVGIYCQTGEVEDEVGYKKAEKNLVRERPYPFELETGKRSRDKTERFVSDKELMELAKECMQYICEMYPRFVFTANFRQNHRTDYLVNEKGMDYKNIDCAVSVSIGFKHVDSKDITDGGFDFSLRSFDKEVFVKMADNYLENFEKEVALPEEIIIDTQYYQVAGMVANCLNGERLALGTSLLSGKIGEKVFSEDFTLMHDISDEECWFDPFWDGDGCVIEGDKRVFIENGVVLSGYADKKTARKYDVPHTGNAYSDYTDIPGPGGLNLRIARSEKTVKELLNGKYCVVPVLYSGGGFADNGEYTMPVQCALLSDGEKILGKLPPFTMVSNMFDMFGKDFIGVGANNPIYNDKQILFRVKKGEIL